MYRLIPLLPALLFASAAFAQTMPDGAHKDLWCGTAFKLFLAMPDNSAAAADPSTARFLEGADKLIERSGAAMLAAGFAQDAVDKTKADLLEPVGRQVSNQEEPEFGPDECTLLIDEVVPPPTSSTPPESSVPAQ